MAIENYWETDYENNPYIPDQGGSPAGEVDYTPAPPAVRTRPEKPSSAGLMPGTEWVFNEQYWTWETKPIAGYVAPNTNTTDRWRDRNNRPTDDPGAGWEWYWQDEPGGGGRWGARRVGSTGGDDGGGGGGGGGTGTMGAIGDMRFDPTTPIERVQIQDVGPAPAFNAPRYKSPGAFKWEKPGAFKAPDAQAVFEDPGFQTRLDLGKKAIENSASARGASRAGATYKGLIDYAETMGSQEYGQVYGRRASEYDRTYRNAFEDAVTGYGFLLSDADKQFQTEMAATSAEYQPGYATWQSAGDRAKSQAQLDFQRSRDQAQFDFERERDQTNLDWTRSVFGSDDAYRNNALIASILQGIFSQGRPTAPA